MSTATQENVGSIVWFQIAADDMERAKAFYSNLFGWKVNPFRGMTDYQQIETGRADGSPNGGLAKRDDQNHPIITYFAVESVDESAAKIKKHGGKILQPKTAVPQMGYFAVCQDTEKNTFGIWELNDNAQNSP